MSLRRRLVLAAAYLLAVVIVALEVPLALNVERRFVSEFEALTLGHAALLASEISDQVARLSGASGEVHPAGDIVAAVDQTSRDSGGARVVVVDQQGRVLVDGSGEAAAGTLYATGERPELLAALGGSIDTRVRFSDTLGEDLLLVTVPILEGGTVVGAVRLSQSLASVKAKVHRTWLGLALVGLVALGVGLALAWVLAGSLARPVDRLEGVAVRLGQGDLGARAVPEGPKEVATLARSFNRMADAVESNTEAQRDFVANASHQLRTPLTGLGLRLEVLEGEGGRVAEQAARARAELNRLTALVEDLLQLARATTVSSVGSRVQLDDVARDAVERWEQTAERERKEVSIEAGGGRPVWADPADLEHVLDNLIENAIRYSPPGSHIAVATGERGGRPTLSVTDDGPGIASTERERIFERFYRGSAGKRTGPGTGLGLAIVAELVQRWGGEVRLDDGPGTRVVATFPPSTTEP